MSSIVTIRPNDSRWTINDGFSAAPRAAFEISTNCPHGVSRVIIDAINSGYITPVAYVLRNELTFEKLL